MGVADWGIATAVAPANENIAHAGFQHLNVPVPATLTHDTWCRKIDIDDSSPGYGRLRFKYNGADAGSFTVEKSVSIRALVCLGLRPASEQCVILGARMGDTVPDVATDEKSLAENGYHLVFHQDGTNWILTLYRTLASVSTELWTANLGSGAEGDYLWFHIRLDFLLQPNGDALLQVFTSDIADPATYDPSSPVWSRISGEATAISELAADVPEYAGVGWGAQVEGGSAGEVYETYVDWVECWYST